MPKSSSSIHQTITQQFGASIAMLANAIHACPVALWNTSSEYWYKAYHCLFWTDYYLTRTPASFAPPAPFTLSEFEPNGTRPERIYTKEELLHYLHHCQQKSKQFIDSLSAENFDDRWINGYKDFSILELYIYNIRHIQHHVAQLNLLLRQGRYEVPEWVIVGR